VLHLRLNARVITDADAAPLLAELGRAGPDDQSEAPVGDAFPPDLLTLALENLAPAEADLLTEAVRATGGTACTVAMRHGGTGELESLLTASRRQFATLVEDLGNASGNGPALGREVKQALANYARRQFDIRLGARRLSVGPRPAIMGVLNVTPDSFSDGGRFLSPADAVRQAERLVDEGADLVDVGGESTRPGSDPVPEDVELARVLPVIETLASRLRVPISIDTRRARVAREATSAGASLINDVTGLLGDPDMPAAVAESGAGCVLMHMRGRPKTMQVRPQYDNLMADICRHLRRGMQAARDAGVPADAVIVDPGIGFGKTLAHNLEILARLGQLRTLGAPVMVGPSRKRFIGDLTGVETPADRVPGTAAACALAVAAGALLVRVHDVAEVRQALAVAAAVAEAGQRES